ncbi:hypothetical protein, partial [Qipengyuania sp. RANM35]|uniref:hypothetical protein n=1 Tax=Qipengyuania sp. RANM35 TaxID=3068635 RepID=UPI0034DB5A35
VAGATVYEITPAGYTQTLGQAGYVITGTSGADQTNLDFANFEDFDLSGFKWSDDNGNGVWDEGTGAVLEGWTIIVDTDQDPTNGYLLVDITDANGQYEFIGLNPFTSTEGGTGIIGDVLGNYSGQTLYVYEVQQEGFNQTYGGYTFVIESGADVTGSLGVAEVGNFGNDPDDCNVNRTPGFWQSLLGRSFFDGILDNQGDSNGPDKAGDGSNKDFDAEGWSHEDLLDLYGVDLLPNDSDPNTSDNDHFALWDANGDGIEQAGDIFLTVSELASWVSGGPKGGGNDYLSILERDVAATFLNTLNHNAVCDDGEGDPTLDPTISDAYEAAIQFILQYDPDFNGIANASKNGQRGDWYAFGSDAHIALAAFNESGETTASEPLSPLVATASSLASQLMHNDPTAAGHYADASHMLPPEDLSVLTQTMQVA